VGQMPDFNTERPQGPTEPNRLRTLLLANRLRTLLVGSGILLSVVAVFGATLLIVSLGADPELREQPRAEFCSIWQTEPCTRTLTGASRQTEERPEERPEEHLIMCDRNEVTSMGVCGVVEEEESGSEPGVYCMAKSSAAVKPSDCGL
jgi:hypothetical protein